MTSIRSQQSHLQYHNNILATAFHAYLSSINLRQSLALEQPLSTTAVRGLFSVASVQQLTS